jgi:hypothetical protein
MTVRSHVNGSQLPERAWRQQKKARGCDRGAVVAQAALLSISLFLGFLEQ